MQSSDGVLFHFPRLLLQYASPFFRDMFGISEHARETITLNTDQPLVMEEDSVTLDNLLQWVDPNQCVPTIITTSIANFIRAAHKYQVNKVIEWFANVVTAGQETACGIKNHRCLLSTEPMLVLSLAEQYDLPDLARTALQQLVMVPVETLFSENATMSARLLLHLQRIRKQRTEWFLSCIQKILYDPDRTAICTSCSSCLMAWTRLVHDAPCWRSIDQCSLTFTQYCSNCARKPQVFSTRLWKYPMDMASWKTEAKGLEEQLPALPKDILRGKN